MNSAPIGIFDSGLGGLSVAVPMQKQLQDESLIYVADSAYCPYGKKEVAFLQARTEAIARFLLKHGCKAIVVACNTATVAAIGHLRSCLSVPIIGVEPAIRPAAAATATGIVGVLATPSTLGSAQYAALVARYASEHVVLTQACPGWVEAVEEGRVDTLQTFDLVKRDVQPLLDAGVDTLVLGCTHFPFLRALIERVAGTSVRVVDPGLAVTRQVHRQLIAHDLLAPSHHHAEYHFYTTGTFNDVQVTWVRSVWPVVQVIEQTSI